jgi:hypothetical protein
LWDDQSSGRDYLLVTTHTCAHTYTHTHTNIHTHIHTPSLSLSLSLTHTHTNTHTHTHSLTHSLTHSHTQQQKQQQTHTHTGHTDHEPVMMTTREKETLLFQRMAFLQGGWGSGGGRDLGRVSHYPPPSLWSPHGHTTPQGQTACHVTLPLLAPESVNGEVCV